MTSKEAKKEYHKEYHKKYYQKNKEEIKARVKKYRQENPGAEDQDKRKARSKRYREKNPIKSRLWTWKKRGIDITIDGYKKIYKEQEGCCRICGVNESDLKDRLCLDHDHRSGRVRGLLCRKCNSMLGFIERETEGSLRDPIPILKKAIIYISTF
jgi:hypothetical protein